MDGSAKQQDNRSIDAFLRLAESYAETVRQLAREDETEKKRPRKELVLFTGIAGIQFYVNPKSEDGLRLLETLPPGTKLVLRREPENVHDRWAIAVETGDGIMLGHVTRFKNEAIARMMDHGHRFEAVVEERNDQELDEIQRWQAPTEQFVLPFSVWLID